MKLYFELIYLTKFLNSFNLERVLFMMSIAGYERMYCLLSNVLFIKC